MYDISKIYVIEKNSLNLAKFRLVEPCYSTQQFVQKLIGTKILLKMNIYIETDFSSVNSFVLDILPVIN